MASSRRDARSGDPATALKTKKTFLTLDRKQIGHHLGLGLLPLLMRQRDLVVTFGVDRAVEPLDPAGPLALRPP